MSDFRINGDMFGMYVRIPTDFSGALHTYKVVGLIESNSYCDVPVKCQSEPVLHDNIVPVLLVIHCGICEEKVVRVALSDCVLAPKQIVTTGRVAKEYLEICGNDCGGDCSVGIPPCPFFRAPDIDEKGNAITGGCELEDYCNLGREDA